MTTQTPEEQLDYLLESVWHPTNKPITVAEIVEAVGSDAARLVVGTLQAGAGVDPLLASSWQAISTVGMLLSSLERQEMIDQLAIGGSWPDAVRDAVKALGGYWGPRWADAGYESEPILADVERRMNLEVTRITWSGVRGVVDDRLHTGSITTWAEVVAIVEAAG